MYEVLPNLFIGYFHYQQVNRYISILEIYRYTDEDQKSIKLIDDFRRNQRYSKLE